MMTVEDFAARHAGPESDGASADFFAAAAEDRLVLKQCGACGSWAGPQAACCPRCLEVDLGWAPASGEGEIHTWTVVHHAPPPFDEETPYVLAEVELAEGPHLQVRVLGIEVSALRMGMLVRARFCHPERGASYPVFVPAATAR